eukprot:scaffold4278_cov173-Amphora_coffeaeformis.AAC.10
MTNGYGCGRRRHHGVRRQQSPPQISYNKIRQSHYNRRNLPLVSSAAAILGPGKNDVYLDPIVCKTRQETRISEAATDEPTTTAYINKIPTSSDTNVHSGHAMRVPLLGCLRYDVSRQVPLCLYVIRNSG